MSDWQYVDSLISTEMLRRGVVFEVRLGDPGLCTNTTLSNLTWTVTPLTVQGHPQRGGQLEPARTSMSA
jgi:hypothetical protein